MYKKQSQPSRVLQQGVSSHLELAPRHCCLGQNMRIKIHFYDIHLLPTVSIQKLLLNFLRKWEGKWNRFSLPVEPSLPARCFYVHRSTRIFAASFNRKSYNSWLELLFNWKQYFRYWRLTRIDFRCRHKAQTNQLYFSQGLQKHWEPTCTKRTWKPNLHLPLQSPGYHVHPMFSTNKGINHALSLC